MKVAPKTCSKASFFSSFVCEGGFILTLKNIATRYKYPRVTKLKKVLAKAVLTVFFSCYSEVCLEQTCILRRKASTGYEGKAASFSLKTVS